MFYEFKGIIKVITKGIIACSGPGFNNQTDPCPIITVNGTNHVESAQANCHSECLYSGIITIASNTGNVNLYIDTY